MSCAALSPAPAKRPIRVLPLTQEERDEIVSMLADAKPVAEIVDWIGCSVAQVRSLMHDPRERKKSRIAVGGARTTPVCQAHETAVLSRLAIGPAALAQVRAAAGISTASADHLMRRLERQKRVVRLTGGRHMPHRQKACVWALPEGEGA